MQSNIKKLYLSNFLSGLVFWYGIEKLFMRSIGITATGIGIAAAVGLTLNLLLDVPAGVVADLWSRKGMLVLSAIFMAISSIILGSSHTLGIYIIGYAFYSLYVVSTSGTYQAIMYDSLHEVNLSDQYSKLMGRAYGIFLAGAGIANISSGFIANHYGYRIPFFITVFSCIVNAILILTIKEPVFHNVAAGKKILKKISNTSREIAHVKLLRILTIIWSALTIIELYKSDFGQLYMLHYVTSPQLIGLLWAAYAFTWSLGSIIAHRLKTQLNLLVFASVLPLILMSLIDNRLSLILFMIQAIASSALFNQIETRIQDSTSSSVRSSVLSVLSSLGRLVSIPASFLIGWLIHSYNVVWALRWVTLVAVLTLMYWYFASKKGRRFDSLITSESTIPPPELTNLP